MLAFFQFFVIYFCWKKKNCHETLEKEKWLLTQPQGFNLFKIKDCYLCYTGGKGNRMQSLLVMETSFCWEQVSPRC